VTLTYPVLAVKSTILVSVECLFSGRTYIIPMLIDTGCDETSFPAYCSERFGHNNHDRRVKKSWCSGVGGRSRSYIHSVEISLLHPGKSTHQIAWRSNVPRAAFIENLNCTFGLIGMDVIKEWKSLFLKNTTGGLQIVIKT
jgi:hypothetical protein